MSSYKMMNANNCCPLRYCTMRTAAVYFVTCNLYLSGQLVRLVLKVIMQNNKKFMEVILHFTFIKCQVNLIYSFKDFLFLHE